MIVGDNSALSQSTESIPGLSDKIQKLPAPSARERAVAKKFLPENVTQILNSEINSASAAAIAADRLVLTAKTIGDPAIQYVVLDKAEELAILSGDAVAVVSAIRQIDKHFEIDFWKRAQKSIEKTTSHTSAQTVLGFKIAIDELIEEAIENGLYSQANKLLSIAIRSAKSSQSTDLIKEYERIEDDVKFLAGLQKQNSLALKTLAVDPENARANLHLGNYLLVCEDDIDTAMRHWKKSESEELVEVAELESGNVESKPLKLAGAWRGLVKGSKHSPLDRKCLEQAYEHYGEASRSLSGREEQIVKNIMDELKKLLSEFSSKTTTNSRQRLEQLRRERLLRDAQQARQRGR
jgi:hypothetical protein